MSTIRVIRVSVPADLIEDASDRMWSWGVRGIEESPPVDGRVTLSTSVGDDGDDIARALATLDPSWPWQVVDVDASIADDWKRFAEPVRCRDDIVIAPAWWDGPLDEDSLVIRIDPGAAFGLGDHPTTRSAARALADELDRRRAERRPAVSVLDVGCGSGVLAVLAAIRGAYEVRAVDLASAAVSATRSNAERNGVAGQIFVDRTPIGHLPIPEPDGYDIVVANILAPILVDMAEDLRRLLAPNGSLIISGVLSAGNGHGHQHVLDALHPLRHVSTIDDAGWATITLTD